LGQRFYYVVFKNSFVYALALVALYVCHQLIRPFSLRTKFSFGRLIGNIWYIIDFVNRELCRRDMALAIGDTHSLKARRRARRLAMANTMAYIVETYFTTSLSRDELLCLVRNPEWAAPLQETLKKGKGAIVLTGHFCNEGLLCYLVSAHGHASCVARYQRVFNNLMVKHRKRMNVDTLNEFQTSYELLLKLLAENEIILATIDRPLKRVKGVHVRFLGHTVIAPYYHVDVARLSGAPIFVALLTRNRDKYDMHINGPIHVPADMEERRSREEVTQQVYSILEEYISRYPHEWQWQHKRFTKKHWGVPRYT
jgi:lauroyl/myristoyl acyltransferase